jgi:hypothetical protein
MKTKVLGGKIGFLGGEKETWRWEEKSSSWIDINYQLCMGLLIFIFFLNYFSVLFFFISIYIASHENLTIFLQL